MKCAVLGDPIAHSLSPALHRAGYAEVGLDWTYDAVQVASGALGEFLGALGDDVRGLSLTMPLKREVMALVRSVSDRAALVGAANTVVIEDGVLHADNTDLPGAIAALRERYAGPVRTATILGAGATAASVGLALCTLGAETITLLARSPERAQETSDAIGRHPSMPLVLVEALGGPAARGGVPGDVLVSTVPAEAQDTDLLARCAGAPVVFDVLYDPWPTPLAAAAAADGRVLVGGLDLLVHQAAAQFELFTGSPAPLAAMRAAGEQALAARSSRGGGRRGRG